MQQEKRVETLRLALLGPPRVEVGGEERRFQRAKALALLAYLAVTRKRVSRRRLASLLWPECDEARGRAALRRVLFEVRQVVGRSWVDADHQSLRLRREAVGLEVDLDRFEQRLGGCSAQRHGEGESCPRCVERLAAAADLYRGELLEGFAVDGAPELECWRLYRAESLRRGLLSTLRRLVLLHRAAGDLEAALGCARRWLATDPLDEAAHRQMMELLAWSGQRAAAVRQYERCAQMLDEELGSGPSEETVTLLWSIKLGGAEGRSQEGRQVLDATSGEALQEPLAVTLVLDSLEQLRVGAPLLNELLARCPGAKLVVTSRERLG